VINRARILYQDPNQVFPERRFSTRRNQRGYIELNYSGSNAFAIPVAVREIVDARREVGTSGHLEMNSCSEIGIPASEFFMPENLSNFSTHRNE